MPTRIMFILTALAAITLTATSQQLYLTDVLEPIFPDSNTTARFSPRTEIDIPGGAPADVHVLLETKGGEKFTLSAVMGGRTLPMTCWSLMADVPVEENTGLDSRTEQFTKQRNPYVIRRAPFRIYEVARPMTNASVTATKRFTALRLSIPPATVSGAGTRTVTITARGRNWTKTGTFTVRVHRAALPALAASNYFYTNWFNINQMEKQHRLTRWSPAWFSMLDRYAALMAAGRQNCVNIPNEFINVTHLSITLDEQHLLSFIDTFRRHGFRYFESPHLMSRSGNDDWNDPELTVTASMRRYRTPEGKRDVTTIVTLLRDFIRQHDLAGSWLQHISDEPGPVQAQCYRDVVAQVRSIAPEMKIMEAVSNRDSIAGSVDLWCPTIDDFQRNEAFFRGRERHGEKVLVYTCLIPGGQWLNRLLDQERVRQVYFGWGASLYNTAGYLHWGLNQYLVEDPYAQSVVHHPTPGSEPQNFLPAGDSHIIYPDASGPVTSTRFEAMRIGVEDYELLRMVKQRDQATALRIIGRVFRNYTDYTTDIAVYRAARKELLDVLDR